jgi:hypothetical protein
MYDPRKILWVTSGHRGRLQPRERDHRTLHKVHLLTDKAAARPDVVMEEQRADPADH